MNNPMSEQEAIEYTREYLESRRKELEMRDPRLLEKLDRGILASALQQGEVLPPDMANRAADYILGKEVKPGRGRSKEELAPRDLYIAMAVWRLTKKGFHVWGNKSTIEGIKLKQKYKDDSNYEGYKKTACHIVAEVINEMFPSEDYKEYPRSPWSVRDIWEKKKYLKGNS